MFPAKLRLSAKLKDLVFEKFLYRISSDPLYIQRCCCSGSDGGLSTAHVHLLYESINNIIFCWALPRSSAAIGEDHNEVIDRGLSIQQREEQIVEVMISYAIVE
jgi:hypothetical protein